MRKLPIFIGKQWFPRVRLAGKKFGHPAGMQKINLEKARQNKSRTAKNLN